MTMINVKGDIDNRSSDDDNDVENNEKNDGDSLEQW